MSPSSAETLAAGSTAPPRQRMATPLRALLERLDESRVRYCHWKGNVRLAKALAGERDVDLLVERGTAADVSGALAGAGFRRLADADTALPGVEHHIALDHVTGKLVHLHLHYQLLPTKGNVAGYRLPWEELVLASRVRDEATAMYVADPALELLLFLVCRGLRVTARHVAKSVVGRPFLDQTDAAELTWLEARSDYRVVQQHAERLLGARGAGVVAHCRGRLPSVFDLLALRRAMQPPPAMLRTRGRREAVARRMLSWLRERSGSARRRTLPNGGLVVSFLGSDGAGKSTVVDAISRWLGPELDVVTIYFGSGDGPASLTRRALRAFDRVRVAIMGPRARVARRARTGTPASSAFGGADGAAIDYVEGIGLGPRALWKILSKLSLAREKRARLEQSVRARGRGSVVVCDRYPQMQQLGRNDSPLLTGWLAHPSRLLRAAARHEVKAYEAAAAFPPDLAIKLIVSPETAARRKHDMTLDELRARASAIRALRFPSVTTVVEVDADQPLELVLRAVRDAIWRAL